MHGENEKEVSDMLGFREDFDFTNRFNLKDNVKIGDKDYQVSTVDLGMDHSFGSGPPLYYETIIFQDYQSDLYGERHTTEKKARDRHEMIVQCLKSGKFKINEYGHFDFGNSEVENDMDKTINKQLKKIADHYGYEAQSRQTIEEMAELTVAINKNWRSEKGYTKGPVSPELMIEELADVSVMIQQLIYLVNGEDEVSGIINEKINRQLKRMEAERC